MLLKVTSEALFIIVDPVNEFVVPVFNFEEMPVVFKFEKDAQSFFDWILLKFKPSFLDDKDRPFSLSVSKISSS